MRVTQQDIARIAKVSQATVSRVLAGDDKVEQSIRHRVVQVMREHNYQPDVRARSLRSKRTGLIGLVVKRPHGGLADDPFFSSLTGAILDVLAGKPYHLCLDMVNDDLLHSAIYDEMLRTRRVDGLILVESEADDDRILRLQMEGFPFVLIGNGGDAGLWCVDNDNVRAGALATRHLIEQGYRRVGFLGGPCGITVSDDRIAGFRSIAGEHAPVYHSGFGSHAARRVAREVLAGGDRPDALVVLDDYMAMGAVIAARGAGLSIPDDLGLVSFNDSSLCELIEGGLSSVSLNITDMVHLAVGRLLDLIEGTASGDPRRTIVPCELKVRGSSVRKGVLK